MTKYWVSWYGTGVGFELNSPWWVSGERLSDDAPTICAAVVAEDEDGARAVVETAHDEPVTPEWRFVEERPDNWTPFNNRFRRADWMVWD